jgi:hypothetical protein
LTADNHLRQAVIDWCKVFGSPKEHPHWTKTRTDKSGKQDNQDDFLQKVLSKTGFTRKAWQAYQEYMVAFRSRYVAHLDLQKRLDGHVPGFDPALQVAYAYDEWSRELLQLDYWNQPTLSSKYDEWKAEASSVPYGSRRNPDSQ